MEGSEEKGKQRKGMMMHLKRMKRYHATQKAMEALLRCLGFGYGGSSSSKTTTNTSKLVHAPPSSVVKEQEIIMTAEGYRIESRGIRSKPPTARPPAPGHQPPHN